MLFNYIKGHEPNLEQDLRTYLQRQGPMNALLHTNARPRQLPAGFQRLTWGHPGVLGSEVNWVHWKHAPHLQRNRCSHIGVIWNMRHICKDPVVAELEQIAGNIEERF